MNPVRRALQEAEELLENRHWVTIVCLEPDRVLFTAGPIFDDGHEEVATYTGVITRDRVSIGHSRI